MAGLGEVLRERNFFFLWLGQIISQFGDRLNQVALIAVVYGRAPGSTFELAKSLSFTIIPSFIVSPIAGAFVDRWDRKKTMIVSDILRGAVVFAIPLMLLTLKPSFPIYAAVFLTFAVSCFFLPARLAIIPDLVSYDKLLAANSLSSVTGMIGAIGWFSVSGFLIELLGVRGGLYMNSVVYFLSAAAVAFIAVKKQRLSQSPDSIRIKEVIRTSLLQEITDGLAYMRSDREVKFVFNVLFILMAGVGAAYAVVIVFIQQATGSITRDLSLLGLFLGSGFLAGSLLYGKLGHRFRKKRAIFVCLVLSGIAVALFTALLKWSRAVSSASVATVMLGMFIAPIGISTNTLIHEAVPEKMRGRIFSFLGIVMNFAMLVFMLIASRFAERIDRSQILYCVSIFFIVSGILGTAFCRGR